MATKRLSNGQEIPYLGLGTWELGNVDGNGFDRKVVTDAIHHAVAVGYRHFDCASDYLNEYLIGDALSELIEAEKVSRRDLFITGKLNQNYHRRDHVRKQLMKTLHDLNTEYLDLFLIHWPFSFEFVDFDDDRRGFAADYDSWTKLKMPGVSLQETWRAMEELVDEGLVKSIGVSNFNVQLLYDLLSYARHRPVVNQVELHPFLSQTNLVRFCHFAGIDVIAYAPLGTPGNQEDKKQVLLDDAVLNEIGHRLGVSAAQVALKWNIQRNVIVVTKSNHKERISENKSLDFKLGEQDMERINALNRNYRFLRPEEWGTTEHIPIFD